MLDGIPDMRVFRSGTSDDTFDERQARYEADLHDEEAESDYERTVINKYGLKTRLMVEKWSREIGGLSAATVLDYGCGTGQVSRIMARHIKPLFAFDISEKSLRKNVRENGVVGILANSLYLPFKDGAFDCICVNGVLHHIVNVEKAVAELARVCSGSLYISEGIPREGSSLRAMMSYPGLIRRSLYFFYLALRRLWPKRNELSDGDHGSKYERPLDVNVVRSLAEAHGFQVNRLLYYTNIDIPGDGFIKKALTRGLVNGSAGTHFDLRMDRVK